MESPPWDTGHNPIISIKVDIPHYKDAFIEGGDAFIEGGDAFIEGGDAFIVKTTINKSRKKSKIDGWIFKTWKMAAWHLE